MPHNSKNSTESGNQQKSVKRFQILRLYLILGTFVLFALFGIYIQILIQNAKQEQQYVPRVFAQYIAYTERYLKESEAYTQKLTELFTNYIQISHKQNFQQELWDYVSTEFVPHYPIPIIITDASLEPTLWNQVPVAPDTVFSELSRQSQNTLRTMLEDMQRIELIDDGELTGFAFYARPVSFERFIKDIDIAIIVTDRAKRPLFWRNMKIAENLDYEALETDDRDYLAQKVAGMTEIPISNADDNLGFIYFSAPASLSQIRYFVLLEIGVAIMLIFFSSYGLLLLRKTEKDTLWIGLAKETAHQFGTPITSLMGWMDYLRECKTPMGGKEEFTKIVDMMSADLDHLKNIASRFGKVGSTVKLIPHDLESLLINSVDYFKNRLPHLGSRMDIHLISKVKGIRVMLDVELFKWTLENLIKNCIDAMSNKGGTIIITSTTKSNWAYIHIRDEGKGIPRSQWKKIFDPGVTSKKRGWGLGLSLAKRIIEEYHHGHIKVVESTIGEGTTFEIKLHIEHISREKT